MMDAHEQIDEDVYIGFPGEHEAFGGIWRRGRN